MGSGAVQRAHSDQDAVEEDVLFLPLALGQHVAQVEVRAGRMDSLHSLDSQIFIPFTALWCVCVCVS